MIFKIKNVVADSGLLNKCITQMIILFLVLVVTAAGFCGFFSKWALRDGDRHFGIDRMINGTASRPFVHRQLIPKVTKTIIKNLPHNVKKNLTNKLQKEMHFNNIYAKTKIPKGMVLEYYLVVIITFVFFYASVIVLASTLAKVTGDKISGYLTSLLFALLIPFLEAYGGYYYDFAELFFLFSAANLALNGFWKPLIVLSVFALANKEAYFWFLPTLYPFFSEKYYSRKTIFIIFGCMFLCGIEYLYISQLYSGNAGGATFHWFLKNLKSLVSLKFYFNIDTTYGLPLGYGFFFIHIVYVFWVFRNGWRKLPDSLKKHIKIASAINIPLYLLFCYPGEVRNLSLLYFGFNVMIAFIIKNVLDKRNIDSFQTKISC